MRKGRAIAAAAAQAAKERRAMAVISNGRGNYSIAPAKLDGDGVVAVDLPGRSSAAIGIALPIPGYMPLPAAE